MVAAAKTKTTSAGAFALLLWAVAATTIPTPAAGAVINRSWLERHGAAVVLHFTIAGHARWQLRRKATELRIELPGTRADLPTQPFAGAQLDPLKTVRVITTAQGAEIRIVARGRSDYLIGRQNGELLIGFAPSGSGVDLGALFAALRRPATPAYRPLRASTGKGRPGSGVTRPAAARPALHFDGEGPLVVIDPGHGGIDPGTRSASGVLEKDLTLVLARRLALALGRRGVRTLLTRDRDIFLTLPQRTAIANRAHAALFVSIHLNWSPDPNAAGLQVYYLDNTTDRATLRLARMENAGQGSPEHAGPALNYILSDLRQQYKAIESSALAREMEKYTVLRLKATFGDTIHGLGVHHGPFYVLVGAAMPAVLVECGFLSNPRETSLLLTPSYQQVLADGLADAIVRYLDRDLSAGTL